MKVLLAAFPCNESEGRYVRDVMPPLALYVLASALRARSHDVIVLDPNNFVGVLVQDFETKLLELVKDYSVDAIGLSSNSFNYALARRAAIILKKHFKNMIIIGGGLHVSIFDRHVMKTAPFDFIIRGEGEITLISLLDSIEKDQAGIQHLSSVTYRDGNKIIRNPDSDPISVSVLEQLPLPAYNMIPINSYDTIAVETSRGCRYSCAFCSIQHRHSWRGFSVENVLKRVAEAKKYISAFNYKNVINLSDDCFTEDTERAVEILECLQKKQDGFKYFFEARVSNLLKNNLVERINPNLVSQMQIGVECGYDEGLKRIHKGITTSQLYECLARMKRTGLNKKAFLSFIIGFPWESTKEINMTLNAINRIAHDYETLCNLNWLIFLPSEIWNNRRSYGINIDEDLFDDFVWYTSPDYFFTCHPTVSRNEFKTICKRIFDMQSYSDLIRYNVPIILENV